MKYIWVACQTHNLYKFPHTKKFIWSCIEEIPFDCVWLSPLVLWARALCSWVSGSTGLSSNPLSPSHLALSDVAEPGWNAEWQQVFNTHLWRLEMMLQQDQDHYWYLTPAGVARSSWMPWSRKALPFSATATSHLAFPTVSVATAYR